MFNTKNKKKLKKSPPKKFDPTIKKRGTDEVSNIVWTTETVEKAKHNISNGVLTKSPFFENDPLKRNANIVWNPSKYELDEYFNCMIDLHYFAEKWCKLKNDDVVGHIKLRDYQDEQLRAFLEEPSKRHIMLWSRQASKTTTSCIYILWEMTFKNNKLTAILGNKLDTSKEVLTKIKEIYELLPFFLQAGIVGWNEKAIAFDNKCIILARACTKDALNSLTVYILYIDEFAFCFDGDKKKQEEFLSQSQPTLASSKKAVLIITSTPNGKDLFFELYNKAVKGQTTFIPSKVYWWQIPDRDLEWAKRMISEIGLEKFKIQFELSFDATMDKLLNPSTMKILDKSKREYIDVREQYDHGFFENYVNENKKCAYRIDPKILDENYDLQKEFHINISDLAEGLGGNNDFTTLHTIKICHKMVNNKPYIYFKQIGVFESNTISLPKFSKFTCELHTKYINQINTRYLFEANKYGDFHRLKILNIGDDDFDLELYPETFFKFRRNIETKKMSVGLLTNSAIKKLSVNSFKKAMENGLFELNDSKTIEQIKNFQKDDKGRFQAEVGHDDLVTPFLHLSWIVAINPMSLQELIEDYYSSKNITIDNIRYLVDLDSNDKYLQGMKE